MGQTPDDLQAVTPPSLLLSNLVRYGYVNPDAILADAALVETGDTGTHVHLDRHCAVLASNRHFSPGLRNERPPTSIDELDPCATTRHLRGRHTRSFCRTCMTSRLPTSWDTPGLAHARPHLTWLRNARHTLAGTTVMDRAIEWDTMGVAASAPSDMRNAVGHGLRQLLRAEHARLPVLPADPVHDELRTALAATRAQLDPKPARWFRPGWTQPEAAHRDPVWVAVVWAMWDQHVYDGPPRVSGDLAALFALNTATDANATRPRHLAGGQPYWLLRVPATAWAAAAREDSLILLTRNPEPDGNLIEDALTIAGVTQLSWGSGSLREAHPDVDLEDVLEACLAARTT